MAAFEPKKKRVAAGMVSNPLPMIVTVVPPRGVPDEGEIEFSDGTKVKVADPAARRPLTVTVTVTLPTPAGDVAWHWVLLEHETLVAALGPKLTVVDPKTNPLPLRVTTVPPAAGPEVGEIDVSAGAAGVYEKVADPVAGTPPTMTVTVTLPAPAGDVAWHWVLLEHETLVAGLGPKLTAVDPDTNPLPLSVTIVPPAAGPDVGEIAFRVAPPPPHADR